MWTAMGNGPNALPNLKSPCQRHLGRKIFTPPATISIHLHAIHWISSQGRNRSCTHAVNDLRSSGALHFLISSSAPDMDFRLQIQNRLLHHANASNAQRSILSTIKYSFPISNNYWHQSRSQPLLNRIGLSTWKSRDLSDIKPSTDLSEGQTDP